MINKNLEEQVTYLQQEVSELSNELYSQQKEINAPIGINKIKARLMENIFSNHSIIQD